jgi:predicted acyltransferase
MNDDQLQPAILRSDRPANMVRSQRLVSLDAYRGFIMVMLAASGFGIARLARLPEDAPIWQVLDYDIWQNIAFHFDHPEWVSQFNFVFVSFWDLIQPAFMFMVGVAMPYSYARRASLGHSWIRQFGHAVWRALVLVLMGVFLQSQHTEQTNWIFTNVLSQIGLGFLVLYVLVPRKPALQWAAFAAILIGYCVYFESYTPPADYDYAAVKATEETVFQDGFASWSKNANAGYQFDQWFLNLFPHSGDEASVNAGGYLTLNFVPSIATMLLGAFCGQLLRSDRKPWDKFWILVMGGACCMLAGLVVGWFVCPIVKRIWTPSWVLFSGAWVVWMLAGFYLVFDLWGRRLTLLKWLAFPLVVVGMNSIVMYMMGQLLRPRTTRMCLTHFGSLLETAFGPTLLADDMYGRIAEPTLAFLVFWLIELWMYRRKIFVRI